ncbi:MAG: polyhydroxyalkanoate synthesis repressor PhaR [Bauldia sp.]|nr:polyhydroxyalkanoate synthesis repressor PhaR [Bauldia sp.]
MAQEKEPIVIKKYANRRLYHTGTSTYVTLEDLAAMVKRGEDFVVNDAKTGEDITRSVLTQIIFEQENKGEGVNLLPVQFLRQLIRFYGDSMQTMVPTFLNLSIESLTREQEKLRSQFSRAFGANAFEPIQEQVKRNTEMFQQAMRMFMPFAGEKTNGSGPGEKAGAGRPGEGRASEGSDLDAMRQQLEEMKRQLDKLARGG